VKLIAGGRTLQDDAQPLSAYSVGPATRVLVTRGAAAAAAVAADGHAAGSEAARLAHIGRLKAAVRKLASRGDGRGLGDQRELSLENQVCACVCVCVRVCLLDVLVAQCMRDVCCCMHACRLHAPHTLHARTPCDVLAHRPARSCSCQQRIARRWCLGWPCTSRARPAWQHTTSRCVRACACLAA
jgi:hypothetical protein